MADLWLLDQWSRDRTDKRQAERRSMRETPTVLMVRCGGGEEREIRDVGKKSKAGYLEVVVAAS